MDDVFLSLDSPLDRLTMPADDHFRISPAPPAERFVFRGEEPARVKLASAFGLDLPVALGVAAVRGGRAAIWLGPDEWLLLANDVDPEVFPVEVEVALDGAPCSLVEISHRQVGVVAEGRDAARALSSGCPLDLRIDAFPVGFATRTLFEKAEIVLWRRAPETFHLEVWRSFSPYVVAALAAAAPRRVKAPLGARRVERGRSLA